MKGLSAVPLCDQYHPFLFLSCFTLHPPPFPWSLSKARMKKRKKGKKERSRQAESKAEKEEWSGIEREERGPKESPILRPPSFLPSSDTAVAADPLNGVSPAQPPFALSFASSAVTAAAILLSLVHCGRWVRPGATGPAASVSSSPKSNGRISGEQPLGTGERKGGRKAGLELGDDDGDSGGGGEVEEEVRRL